ncbi:hypothetical protein GCM10007973_02730 [Polymorphobacter multimanifer]|uniref:DUF4230 domain-containing protein n=1 Tax=Polymorphobacter multimanifer TaxID=1070431 RepID=UPI0016668035|nr:DUF4230 domain-containing protein [Polymorphobacter multimanifer]GGI69079.1 hypothetical protein GCM10007973_02730 [Polymorphobacter multimanifer]
MIRVLLGLVAGLVLAFAAVSPIPRCVPSWRGSRGPAHSDADTTLQAIQRQQRLGGLPSASKTLIIPGTIRYEVDLSALKLETMRWNKEEQTLTIFAPRPVIAGPEVDLTRTTEYKDGALLLAFTDVEKAFDTANRAAVAANMRAQGASRGLVDLADEAARDTIGRLFLLPLITAGHADARVKVTFVTPPRPDLTTPPQE